MGASAGGLDALLDFFAPIPADCGVAFLVIQHLSPDHKSIMDELLAPHVKMPIVEAGENTRLEPNTICLCPPGVIPHADGFFVRCEPRSKDGSITLPIDLYFGEMGSTLRESAIGVVLSGTGSDGSLGLRSIREHGGRVYVQDPSDAQFSGMPQSAIATGRVDAVASAKDLWSVIAKSSRGESRDSEEPDKGGRFSFDASPVAGSIDGDPAMDGEYEDLFSYLRDCFDLNFSRYRINSVGRRIERRMQLLSVTSVSEYLDLLRESEEETTALYHDLLIGVTQFFRDEEAYKFLAEKVLPEALKNLEGKEFRIWVAGCATGEEAYSLYILALEAQRKVGFSGRISMFATDVFKPSIAAAGAGVFDGEQMARVSKERRDQYFQEISPGHFKIVPEIRENIIFAQHNFLENAPFTKMDLVSCRNVLIYLVPEAQQVALGMFSYALKDGGHLFLGGSESLGKLSSSYKGVSTKHKVFRKEDSALDTRRWALASVGAGQMAQTATGPHSTTHSAVTISRDLLSAYDSLLERFAPCGFLINANREILHYFGAASDYCVNLSGRVSMDLLVQLDSELRLPLTGLIHQAVHKAKSVSARGIRCGSSKGERTVNIAVAPLKDAKGNARVYLVELAERNTVQVPEKLPEKSRPEEVKGIDSRRKAGKISSDEINVLEEELRATRENLEAANEELQVSNEELQATNEEMQVSNEELQSTNEELHSLNEELVTLNSEYERKNEELIEANVNLQNLLESTEDGILFVDKDLLIRNFNPAIASAFNLLPSDMGRPVQHIAYHLSDGDRLASEVHRVVQSGERSETETRDRDGRYYLRRIVPFRRADGGIEGALISFTDVTQFHELEYRFNFAIETVGMSWWDWNLKTDLLEVFSADECILGEGCLDNKLGREGWMALVHPDDRKEVGQSLDAYLEGQTDSWRCEHRFRKTDGEWMWVLNSGRIMARTPNGEPLRMIGTTQNIHSYKETLLQLTDQKEIVDAASNLARLGAWVYDAGKKSVYWSDRVKEILGVGEEFIPNLDNAFDYFPEPDRGILRSAFEKLVNEGVAYDLEVRCLNLRGESLLIRCAARPRFDEKGKLIRVLGLFQDITEVTRTEHEMQAYFSLSPDFQATLDFEGRFKSFSPCWTKTFGLSRDELTGMRLLQLVHAEDARVFEDVLSRVKNGKIVNSHETRIRSAEGEDENDASGERWMSWSLSSDKQLGLIFVSARSVTEQKKASENLRAARIRAEEANRAKTEFLGVMSHELRTPLNPILGFAELLLEEADDPSEKEILQSIVDSGNNMVELINEILDFTKIDAGKAKVEPVEFSLTEFVRGKCKLMRGQIKDRPIVLRWELDEGPFSEKGLPVFVSDVSLLRQICRNIIGNAIKFTEEGEVVFRVRVLNAKSGTAEVVFEVEDTGVGFPEEYKERIFEPFTQADSSSTRKFGGTGLGLAICNRLVKLLNGSIWAESKPDHGTIFRFSIPLKYIDASSEEKNDEANADTVDGLSAGDETHRILVVEDNESNAFFIKRVLDNLGTLPSVVGSGEEALKRLEETNFDLIFLDLHMPGIGGIETLESIRKKEEAGHLARTKVAILTADADKSTKELCMEKGADVLITKPVKIGTVRKVLEDFLDLKSPS